MRKLILGLLSTSLIFSSAPKTNANPAVLAPAAFCAGTAGVGCVLIGVATIGGIAYYVWQRTSDGKRAYVRKYDRPGDSGVLTDYVWADNYFEASKKCKQSSSGGKVVKVTRVGRNRWECQFIGGGDEF